jgi:hypothetical protein
MVEPNRLKQAATPNTIRTPAPTTAPPSWAEPGEPPPDAANWFDPGRPPAPDAVQTAAPAPAVRRGRGRRGFTAGLFAAAVGVPLFFGDSLMSEELGIVLICLGIGGALLSVLLGSARADVAASRRSLPVAIGTIALLPHTALGWVVGLALVAFGALMLIVVLQGT